MTAPPAPLAALTAQGVSVWLDDLSRPLLTTGALGALVRDHGVSGVTTNPAIFAQALAQSAAYADQLAELARRGADAEDAVRALTAYDVRWACDVLRPVHDATGGVDGRVSIEVDPHLAHQADQTVAAARALWRGINRPNLLIKIPATEAALPAVVQCLAEGISVNVTLLFSVQRYRQVLDAHLSGLERARAIGRDLSGIHSVASFFISRVDTEVDARLARLGQAAAEAPRGGAGIANARLAHEAFREVTDSPRWAALAASGARPQRLLWASTGVKDPAYDDTRYVTELVTPGTVNTMPGATLRAVADHGVIRGDTVTGSYAAARHVLEELTRAGVDLGDVAQVLEEQAVEKFRTAWLGLLDRIRTAMKTTTNTTPSPVTQETDHHDGNP
ncbi:transaldolase [Streptomyces sp. NPDC059649]|uniref:transaldolase n=1 Tax=Streptomyces sp. NPDC059649 TaxID=3346895 RepID=UPI0036CFFB93